MKQILTLLFILTSYSIINLQAQQGYYDWVSTQYSGSSVTGMIPFRNKTFVVAGEQDNKGCKGSYIYRFDSNMKYISGMFTEGTDAITLTGDSAILSVGMIRWDDVGPMYCLVLDRFYSTGDTMHRYLFKPYDSICVKPIGIREFPNKSILIYSYGHIIKTSYSGDFLWSKSWLGNISNVEILSNNEFLVSDNIKLLKTDSNGNILSQALFADSVSKPVIVNDTIFITSGTMLFKLNRNLKKIDSLELGLFYSRLINIRFSKGHLWVSGEAGDLVLQTAVTELTTDFTILINTWRLAPDQFNYRSLFEVNDGNFAMTSNGRVGQITFSFFNSSNFKNIPDRPDMAITDLKLSHFVYNYIQLPDSLFNWSFDFTASFTVKNTGNIKITSFTVYSPLSGNSNCFTNELYHVYDKQDLDPGDSIILSVRKTEGQPMDHKYFPLCLTVSTPNKTIESNLLNNKVCGSFFITGIEEDYNKLSGLKIYPNPANNFIFINKTQEDLCSKVEVCITDFAGKKLISEKVNTFPHIIDITKLPAGIYFLTFIDGRSFSTIKMIKL